MACVLALACGAFVPAGAAPRPFLVFTSAVHGGWDVVTLYSDGSISEPLNRASTYGEYPAISPDGKRIAFIGWTAAAVPGAGTQWVPFGQIYVVDLETGAQRLVYSPRDAEIYSLEWSPRGDQLLFTLYPLSQERNPDLWVITEKGPGVWVDEPLITRPGTEQFATWSPNGDRVVYAYNPDRNRVQDEAEARVSTISVSRVDRSDHRRLVLGRAQVTAPVYSPDGKWIAYADLPGYEPSGGGRIRLMRADGSHKRTLAADRTHPWALDFSPDGRFLVWGEGTGWDATRIMQLDLTRNRLTVLIDTQPGMDHMPEYFPAP
jgi:Tol biopolymer transport system component